MTRRTFDKLIVGFIEETAIHQIHSIATFPLLNFCTKMQYVAVVEFSLKCSV